MRQTLAPYRDIEQLPEFTVPHAYVLDYDRTLGDVDAAMERLYTVAGSFAGFDRALVAGAQERTEADGGSFDPLTYVEQVLSPQQFGEFEKQFVQEDSALALLYPEAVPFLQRLTSRRVPHCVLTYGARERWQQLKLAASGYGGAAHIIPHSNKGHELTNWQTQAGQYEFIGYDAQAQPRAIIRAAEAVMIDDKLQSLHDLPSTARGIYLDRTNDDIELPERCTMVHSLGEIAVPALSGVPGGIVSYRPVLKNEITQPVERTSQ